MNPLFFGSLVDLVKSIFDRVIPDPAAAAAAKLELLKLQETGELAQLTADTDLAKAQIATNTAEATNTSLFVAGWRPAIGWVCALSLFTYYVPYCLVATWVWAHQVWVDGDLVARPDLGITDLLGLLGGMLGLAGMRSWEKGKGVASGV